MHIRTNGDTTVASGVDVLGTLIGGASSLVIGGLISFVWPNQFGFSNTSNISNWLGNIGTVLLLFSCAALFSGCRWSVELSPAGIRLTLYRLWFVPAYRRRYLLDADVELYQSFEADRPEGLCIREPLPDVSRDFESPRFGPSWNQEALSTLFSALSQAHEALRAGVPAPPPGLRHPLLGREIERLDLAGAKRDARGRLREVVSKKMFLFCGVEIPHGSTFFLNDDRFLDPRRDDWLERISLGAPATIADLPVKTGASLIFDTAGRLTSLRGAFGPEVEIDGNWVDGRDVIAFGKDGGLSGFTLARPALAGGRSIPQGSRFSRWERDSVLPERWTCWLGGALALPEMTLGPGDSIELSKSGRNITGFSPRSDVTVGGIVIRAGIMPIPLRRDGHVDISKCYKIGLVEDKPASKIGA